MFLRPRLLKYLLHNKRKAILLSAALSIALVFGASLSTTKQTEACVTHGGAVCPQGDVKYEVGSGYEYTDGSATVTIIPGSNSTKNSATWTATECYEVVAVCIKIGGRCGGSLDNPSPSAGSAGPYSHDISHVVLVTRYTCGKPTPTETPTPTPTPTDIPDEPTPTPTEPTATPAPTNGGRSVGGPASPPVCGAPTPDTPRLLSAVRLGGGKIRLNWTNVDSATHYTISYGPNSNNYIYGVPNTGDTTSFEVEGIANGCFVVRAVNDCAPSGASNEVCTSGQVLGLSSTSGTTEVNPMLFWLGLISLILGARLSTSALSGYRS